MNAVRPGHVVVAGTEEHQAAPTGVDQGESDVVFARLDPAPITALQRDWTFHVWDEPASVVRWMTAFDTAESDVDAFLADISAVTGAARV